MIGSARESTHPGCGGFDKSHAIQAQIFGPADQSMILPVTETRSPSRTISSSNGFGAEGAGGLLAVGVGEGGDVTGVGVGAGVTGVGRTAIGECGAGDGPLGVARGMSTKTAANTAMNAAPANHVARRLPIPSIVITSV